MSLNITIFFDFCGSRPVLSGNVNFCQFLHFFFATIYNYCEKANCKHFRFNPTDDPEEALGGVSVLLVALTGFELAVGMTPPVFKETVALYIIVSKI